MDAVAADYAVVGGNGNVDREPMTKRSKVILSAFLSGCAVAFVVLAMCAISGISGNYTYLRTKQADPRQSMKSQLDSGEDFRETEEMLERQIEEAMERESDEVMERGSLLPPKPRLGSVVSPVARQGAPVEQQLSVEKQHIDAEKQLIDEEKQHSDEEPVSVNAGDGPRFHKYAYVIVTYHKMGHALSNQLVEQIQRGIESSHSSKMKQNFQRLERRYINARDEFSRKTKCTKLNLEPGTVVVLEAPEFHCGREVLKHLIMDHRNIRKQKWGVKLIHLVRNPFSMAVSNYHYHRQVDTPEDFVHKTNPCITLSEKTVGRWDDLFVDLAEPFLSEAGIMNRQDFDFMYMDCHILYQTRPGLEKAPYYDHLLKLPPEEGLKMALIDKFTHLALMTTDIILFQQIQRDVMEENENLESRHRTLDILTMSMDNWIDHPSRSMTTFLDFIFKSHMSDERKAKVSAEHEKYYRDNRVPTRHVTHGKHDNNQVLMDSLRYDPVFGPPMGKMEEVVNRRLAYEEEMRRQQKYN
ncbi:hypothetical protein THAOC_32173 [Thalassiosira oceanica]|uniref:Sulfotransferase domain-containing protein n=1 Tax=Thalassiosira oceanica TaxID=159749 RepID=K0R9S1_THAOC|nr:hypothetical protein THAOC_32173 [Thalassiosira oceanica]|eukprot:EJK48989.1 hypothetical protein THAOC_32173 [Thalassiosira oceanica]